MKRSAFPQRTTALRSFVGLNRSGVLAVGQPLQQREEMPQRRAQPRRRDRGEEQDWLTVVRPLVLARCLGLCEWCGTYLGAIWDCHHRILRTRGGPDHVSNAAALHGICHLAGGPDGVHREEPHHRARGFMLASGDIPDAAPLVLATGRRVLLSDSGTYVDMP